MAKISENMSEKKTETNFLQIDCQIQAVSGKKQVSLLFYNTLIKVYEKQSQQQIGSILIQECTTVEWLVRDGSESVHAFDRCDGFKVTRDESRSDKRVSLEKGISGEPLTSVLIHTSKDLKSGEMISQSLVTDFDGLVKQKGVEFYLPEPIQLKRVYNFFAPRVIMKQFHDHYKAQKKLGKGSFASVYQVTHKETGKQLAIKAFTKEKLLEEDRGMLTLLNEINLMKSINHKHLLKLYEVWESSHSFYFVLELANGGSLMDRISLARKSKKRVGIDLNSKDSEAFSDGERKHIMKQLLLGLVQLREKKILHRDIKPDNILLRKIPLLTSTIPRNRSNSNSNPTISTTASNIIQSGLQKLTSLVTPTTKKTYRYEAILIDFGLGTFRDEKTYLFPKCGTPGYVAPEVINLRGDLTKVKYSTQCDMFSVGAVFYFMLTLKPLFFGNTTKETIELNKKCEINFYIPELQVYDTETIDLLRRMLDKDPIRRIDPRSALKHSYFDSINVDFEEELIVPNDSPPKITSQIQQFACKAFDLSRINLLSNSSLKCHLSDSSALPSSPGAGNQQKYFVLDHNNNSQSSIAMINQTGSGSPKNPDFIRTSSEIEDYLISGSKRDTLSLSCEVMDQQGSTIGGGFVNKNGNMYGGNMSKSMLSQCSFDQDKSGKMLSDSFIMNQQDSITSTGSLKMRAHPKQRMKNSMTNGSLLEDSSLDEKNNLRSPMNAVVEGRTKSPSRFKIDFDKTKSYTQNAEFFPHSNTEEISKENEPILQKGNQNLQPHTNLKRYTDINLSKSAAKFNNQDTLPIKEQHIC